MRISPFLCLSVAVIIGMPAAAREPTVLKPVSPWNLHYSDNSCQLIRSFGDPAKPTNLIFESMGPDTGMTMLVFGPALTSKQGEETATASFVPDTGRKFGDGTISETTKDKQTAIYWRNVSLLPDDHLDETREPDRRDEAHKLERRTFEKSTAAGVTALQVTEPRKRVTVLQTGSLGKVMEMVRECNREQMVGWGLDPAINDRIVLGLEARRDLATLFSSSDFPALALSEGKVATVVARLIVSADGKVSKCTSLTPFAGEGFREVVCERLSDATFKPAELSDGTKVPSFVLTRIIFRSP